MKTTAAAQTPIFNGSLSEGLSHLQPDILLASQVRSQANTYHKSESLLMLALLSDALHVLSTFHPQKARRSSSGRIPGRRTWSEPPDALATSSLQRTGSNLAPR